jgi:MSHA biogenesis protein MshP
MTSHEASGRQTGFAAIAAIFLVVILAALGGFMVTFSNTQQLTSAQDVQGTRAYWAARAGLEWAVVALPATPALCASTVLAPPTPIEGFTIVINCTSATYADAGAASGVSPTTIFQFTVAASTGSAGAIGFVERSVSASVER